MLIAMIVAMDNDSSIGQNGGLPWKLSSDIKRFKKITQGEGYNAVIMGRKTWNSLPSKYRPLSGRINIVMSRDSDWSDEGAWNALYPGRAIEIAYSEGCEECWIIGGSQIYELFIDMVDEIHITEVDTYNSGEIKFPKWPREGWSEYIIEKIQKNRENDFDTKYSIWKKD
ncbi:MAG: dihydrofolate reductase [Marine Group II euryarchaeote MED-G38]|nr:MAG: dihydrofolate reductase [Marine Group II euryarchaeote MED-G38]|tara:strand:- start:809 stop:1318 length:510 start_codon:yes stop_codon:yes gene_type:complete